MTSCYVSQVILGESVLRSTEMDQELAAEIASCQDNHSFSTVLGGTMCTDDFYEGLLVREGRREGGWEGGLSDMVKGRRLDKPCLCIVTEFLFSYLMYILAFRISVGCLKVVSSPPPFFLENQNALS